MNRIRTAFATLSLLALVGVALPSHAASVADLYRQSYRLEAEGKAAPALSAMESIKSKAGASYFVSARIAWLSYLSGRYDESVNAYRAAAKLKPNAIEPKLGVTLPLLAQQKWRDLEKACRDVLKLDPRNAVARARLAHAHYASGNYPDAAVVYRQLVEDYPADLNNQTGLAWAMARMGRIAEAKKLFAAVLEVSPDNLNAKQGMAL
jgi:tetratricopeptide (TPR) repeat protein